MKEKEIKVVALSVGIITMFVLLLAGYIFNYYLDEKIPTDYNTNDTNNSSNAEEESSNETNEDNDETNEEYDTTGFIIVSVADYLSIFAQDELNVVLIGRSDCTICIDFLPIIKKVKEDYNLNIYYINIESAGFIDMEYGELLAKDSYINNNFGSTPMTLISQNDKLINGDSGFKDYDELVNYFKTYNVIK